MNKELIDDLTFDIIKIYNISIPILDINEVVKNMGGSINDNKIRPDLEKGQGNSFIINVSPFMTDRTYKFIVAFSLGHLFLHTNFLIDKEKYDQEKDISIIYHGDDYVYQASYFASSLLMPKDIYSKKVIEYTDGNIVNTKAIADYFDVSVGTASDRGKQLGLLKK